MLTLFGRKEWTHGWSGLWDGSTRTSRYKKHDISCTLKRHSVKICAVLLYCVYEIQNNINTYIGGGTQIVCFFRTFTTKNRRQVFIRQNNKIVVPRIQLKKKCAIINGIEHEVAVSKNTPVSFYYRGRYYETEEEVWIAKLLRKMKIKFLHHVRFDVKYLDDKGRVKVYHWHPDFLFERSFEWCGYHKDRTIISGLEVKKKKMGGKVQRVSDEAKQQHGVRILVINREILHQWYDARFLPLEEIAH